MVKNKNIHIVFLVIILLIVLIIYWTRSKEGFYSNSDISTAKSTIDDILSDRMSILLNTVNDMNSNKFTMNVTDSISSLSKDMPNSSDKSRIYIMTKKNQLSSIQKNLNKINDALLTFVGNTTVEQIVNITDEKSVNKIPLLDAINRANTALKKMSKELSEIPE
jgi:hypothetical protein